MSRVQVGRRWKFKFFVLHFMLFPRVLVVGVVEGLRRARVLLRNF